MLININKKVIYVVSKKILFCSSEPCMASCGADGAVKLWSLDSDEPIADIEGQWSGVWTRPSLLKFLNVELVNFCST
jgi:hypothetical protein